MFLDLKLGKYELLRTFRSHFRQYHGRLFVERLSRPAVPRLWRTEDSFGRSQKITLPNRCYNNSPVASGHM